jgi:DNA-binding NarL/FixJ family response regulator
MLARHDGDESLPVLVAFIDIERGERLAASLAELGDIIALTAESMEVGDHAAVVIVDNIAAVKSLPPDTPVILLSDGGNEPIAHDGIAAALRADADPVLIAAAARLAAAGYRISEGAADTSARPLGEAAIDPDENEIGRPVHLSPREAEVLTLLADGAPNKVIAHRLGISVHTVQFHVAAILVKLGAANRTDAIATAMRQGLVLV